MKTLIGHFKENRKLSLLYIAIGLAAFFVLRSCLGLSADRLPQDVQELIDKQYVNCVQVRGSQFEGGNQLESECSTVTTEVVGRGRIPTREQSLGITEAICYRIQYENPYFWAQSQTQYEEITFAKRTASKVAILDKGEWVIFADQEIQDRERWSLYSCPGEYDVTE